MEKFTNFNSAYLHILKELDLTGEKSVTRKGSTLTELYDYSFQISDPLKCIAYSRNLSWEYLKDELNFYVSGSNQLSAAEKISAFWKNCSDDGETINSNYGKLLLYDLNTSGVTQLQHALSCLKNNPRSKKAVMTLYNNDHAYISNDNPCTMFLRLRIDSNNALHLSAFMRSNDVFFGLPYDVPFFVFIQTLAIDKLRSSGDPRFEKLVLGTYSHTTCSMHKYSYKESELQKILQSDDGVDKSNDLLPDVMQLFETTKNNLSRYLQPLGSRFLEEAWAASRKSPCLKKKVGACLTTVDAEGLEILAVSYHGGAETACKVCVREDIADKFYGDECPSVHAEMRCIINAISAGISAFSSATMYTTHGPCDACLKLCDFVGITKVVYDKPYKTNYTHWKNIDVIQLESVREEC